MTNDQNHEFVFYANSPPFDEQQDFIAHIPASIGDAKTLFDVLFENLQLPGYFGFNWDALSECLRDLSWIERCEVVILHHDLPKLVKGDLFIYLQVLRECVLSWRPGEDHQLIAAFPKDVEKAVFDVLNCAV